MDRANVYTNMFCVDRPGNVRVGLKHRTHDRGNYDIARILSIPICPWEGVQYSLPLVTPSEVNSAFRDIEKRKHSFRGKEDRFRQNVDLLAKYGFHFCDDPDKIRCFFCGLGVKDIGGDDPMVTHVMLSPRCQHLRQTVDIQLLESIKNLETLFLVYEYPDCRGLLELREYIQHRSS